MNPIPPTARFNRLVAEGCILIAISVGAACSSGVESPQYKAQSSARTEQTQAQSPPNEVDHAHIKSPSQSTNDDSEAFTEKAEPNQGVLQHNSELQRQLDDEASTLDSQFNEILGLYRRLHIELDDDGRSDLIVALFEDHRLGMRLLGFELVNRDLSSNTVLKPAVSEAAKMMLSDSDATVRAKSAQLITRLVPPDAMIVLVESLQNELDPVAAEPMLLGVARWPSQESVDSVLRWFLDPDSPFTAACAAAWSLEQSQLWDIQEHHPLILERLRDTDNDALGEDGMKLIARIGDASDLEQLVSLLLAQDPMQQRWAANALVETPRSVEVLAQAAEENELLFQAASDAMIRHRATPEGLRRLMTLPYPNAESRNDAIMRMGLELEDDRLGEAVRLSGLDAAQSIMLLNRLLNSDLKTITPRIAKGIILLAQIELDEHRPDRAFEAAITLKDVGLDPADRVRADLIQSSALIQLGKLDEAFALNTDPELWYSMLISAPPGALRERIAVFMLSHLSETLSAQRILDIEQAGGIESPSEQTDAEPGVDNPSPESAQPTQSGDDG